MDVLPKVQTQTLPLTCFCRGMQVELALLSLEPHDAQRLRDLGIREGALISILRDGVNLIVRSGGNRIGLRRELAMCVFGREIGTCG